jgi:hypothetical protein
MIGELVGHRFPHPGVVGHSKKERRNVVALSMLLELSCVHQQKICHGNHDHRTFGSAELRQTLGYNIRSYACRTCSS